MSFIEVIGRVIISFGVLLLMTRIMGKKQVSQLTYFNYITGITIGAVAASITIDTSINMADGFVSMVCWSLLTVLVSYINLKSPKARILLDGQPTIVIKNGEILEKTLAGLRLNMDDLSMLLREKKHFFDSRGGLCCIRTRWATIRFEKSGSTECYQKGFKGSNCKTFVRTYGNYC
jgi:uncharacterized membrane protein YcaP (DUF421 family)